MRRSLLLLGCVLAFSLSAAAQESKVDVFVGYSYARFVPSNNTGIVSAITSAPSTVTSTNRFNSFNANGGVGSVSFNGSSWASFVFEIAGYHVKTRNGASVDANEQTYMAGPRFGFFRYGPVNPFAQILFGVARTDAAFNGTRNHFDGLSVAPGLGLDVNIARHFGLRLAQVDYLLQRMPPVPLKTWNNFRYSGGIVFHF